MNALFEKLAKHPGSTLFAVIATLLMITGGILYLIAQIAGVPANAGDNLMMIGVIVAILSVLGFAS